MIIQNPLLTGSLSYNGADLSNVTSSNANSASVSLILTAVSSSNQQLSASYIALSASYNVFSGSASTRITVDSASLQQVSSSQQQVSSSYIALSASYNTFSGSASTRITTVSSSQQDISASLLQVSASYIALSGSYNTFSGSASTRVTKIENNYATTGSNSFRADQSITGSLVVSSTITAQTLVVQTVTSSILYSSGSNLFGNQLANTQTFTGSVNITGSLALAGNITSNGTAVMLGTGSANYLSKFTAASTIGNSLVYDNGTNVGINTISPSVKLTVKGAATAGLNETINIETGGVAAEDGGSLSFTLGGFIASYPNWRIGQIGAIYESTNSFNGALVFKTSTAADGGTIKMRLSSSGNLGLGVTPSAWSLAGLNTMQIKNAAFSGYLNNAYVSANAYFDSAWKYIANDEASLYSQVESQHIWYQAASGSAGNAITFTQAMTLDASGRLGIGTPTPTVSQTGQGMQIGDATNNVGIRLSVGSGGWGYMEYYQGSTAKFISGYRDTDGTYNIKTGSSLASGNGLSIASTGAATISAPTTDYAFTVNGTALWYTARFIGSATTGQSYGPLITAGTNSSDQSFIVQNKAASSNYFVVRGDGNVGIGTNTPNTYLQIVGNISTTTGLADAQFLTISNSNATPNNYSCIMFKDSDGNNSAGFGVQQISHITNEADIVLSPRLANGDITERMRIKGDGNVGIGTISPDMNGYGANHTILGLSTAVAGKSSQLNLRGNSNATANVMIGTVSYLDSSGTGAGSSLAGIDVYSATATSGRPGSYMVFLTNDGSSTAVPALERMRITSGGNVNIAGSASANTRLTVTGVDSTSSNYGLVVNNTAQLTFGIRNDGYLTTGTASASPYNYGTGGAANCYIDTDGALRRSTSSLKYKIDVRDYDKGLAEVLQMRPVYYKGKNDGDTQFAGLIAEEIHDLGLTEFVQYAEDGSPDALAYSNMIALAFKAIQELKATNDDLQSQINELKAI